MDIYKIPPFCILFPIFARYSLYLQDHLAKSGNIPYFCNIGENVQKKNRKKMEKIILTFFENIFLLPYIVTKLFSEKSSEKKSISNSILGF